MNTPTAAPSRPLPRNTRLRTQVLLDEADAHWFQIHPDEHLRIRFYFLGEKIDGGGEPSRYVIVTRDASGRLVRRFLAETAGDA